MRAKAAERDEARRLRAGGASLGAIAADLGVAKSSVSVWVRDVPVPPDAPYWAGRTPPRPEGALPARALRVWDGAGAQRCSRCAHLLPLTSFNRMGAGRQAYCRPCFKAYYREHRDELRPRWYAVTRTRVDRARAFVLAHMAARACADCGERDAVVLEFDHREAKAADVADLAAAGRGLDVLAAEMAKCDVVCASCHRRRTARRADWIRADRRWRDRLAGREPALRRALELVYGHLEEHGCVDCGCGELALLDFDHLDGKRFTVPRAAWLGVPHEELVAEIARCAVRCANCHRRRTSAAAGHFRSTMAARAGGP